MCDAPSCQDLDWLKWGLHLSSHSCMPQKLRIWEMEVRSGSGKLANLKQEDPLSLQRVMLGHHTRTIWPVCVGWALGHKL